MSGTGNIWMFKVMKRLQWFENIKGMDINRRLKSYELQVKAKRQRIAQIKMDY
jgi:hypothetical protein